jgi:imidazolonepropionase
VQALRAASDEALREALGARLSRMRSFGVTTVEVKSGYGLDTASEVRSLRAIHAVRAAGPTRVVSTFLPLHAVDPALRNEADGRARFLARTLEETLPAALAEGPDFVDAYLDTTGFSVEEARPLLTRARAAGLGLRLHVGQFADVGGAELAAALGAASADHLEHVSDAGLRAMAAAGVVGILLPGAAFSLGQHAPDARRMRAHGVELAIATDCNPGTSYTENLPLMAAFAVRQMGLSIPEAWWGLTRAAARSLARPDLGRIAVGASTDLCVLDLPTWEALPYIFGSPLARATVIDGRPIG